MPSHAGIPDFGLLANGNPNANVEKCTMRPTATATTLEEALTIAADIGKYPIIIRPAFTLGGTGGGIAYNIDELKEIVSGGLQASMTSQVRVGRSHAKVVQASGG